MTARPKSYTPFLSRVVLHNYKSIESCNVKLGSLTYLVGANGAGKSNFLDALHLTQEALTTSLDNALNIRGGINEVRRRSPPRARSPGKPVTFGIRLDFNLPNFEIGHYSFELAPLSGGGYEVRREECVIGLGAMSGNPSFRVEKGKVIASSEANFPAITSDRLALVSLSGLEKFRPIYDALATMGFYNLNPKLIRDLQKPQDGRLLKSSGENIASVIRHLEKSAPDKLKTIEEYMQKIVPTVHKVKRKAVGPMESLEFSQDFGSASPWQFKAMNMSDGTLRALGILTALFQGNADYSPSLIGIEEPEIALHPGASAMLRTALQEASEQTQIIVISHSPDLLDDPNLDANALLVVTQENGITQLANPDKASADLMKEHLFSAGELLRLNQLEPNAEVLAEKKYRQVDLFEERH